MRQRGDETFINLHNDIQVDCCTKYKTKQLQQIIIDVNDRPGNLIFAQNTPKDNCETSSLA